MRIMDQLTARIRSIMESVTSEQRNRARYQESLFTELLTELAGMKILTNDQCCKIIARAKERTAAKERQHDHEDTSPQCPCPLCDNRPHKPMRCKRCGDDTIHLMEDESTARCRVCCTAQEVR